MVQYAGMPGMPWYESYRSSKFQVPKFQNNFLAFWLFFFQVFFANFVIIYTWLDTVGLRPNPIINRNPNRPYYISIYIYIYI